MKKILIVLLSLLFVSSSFAQKVKIKKGKILVDKVQVGTIKKEKIDKKKVYKIVDNSGTHVFNISMISLSSKIYIKSKYYRYLALEVVENGELITIDKNISYFTKKSMGKYIGKKHLLSEDGVNKQALADLLATADSLPPYIQKKIEEEETLLQFVGHKVEKNKNHKLYTNIIETYERGSHVSSGIALQNKWLIFQKVKPKWIHVGYAIHEKFTVFPGENIIFYNFKDVPIAIYDGWTYKRFYPFEEDEELAKSLKKAPHMTAKILMLAKDLVKRDQL